jgi:hypothetical protein
VKLSDILFASTSEFGKRLQDSYRRLRETAIEEWAPALPPTEESHAGLPHTRNVEREIDKLLLSVLGNPEGAGCLTETEAYILLAAIQLHDIGRSTAERNEPHGRRSAELIGGHGTELGLIADKHIIRCVEQVCGCHDSRNLDQELNSLRRQPTTLEGYGMVRLPALAALLALGDEMDESYLRAIPDYVSSKGATRSDARFCDLRRGTIRRLICATEADAAGHCIVSILADCPDVSAAIERWSTIDHSAIRGSVKELSDVIGCHEIAERLAGLCPRETFGQKAKELCDKLAAKKKQVIDGCSCIGPEVAIACVLLDKIESKNVKLAILRKHLCGLGMDYEEWFLDVAGVLFDKDGKQCVEPSLDHIDARLVCDAMKRLAFGIFNRLQFSYEELAAEARVVNLETVRRIVRRVALWKLPPEADPPILEVGSTNWSLVSGAFEDSAKALVTAILEKTHAR